VWKDRWHGAAQRWWILVEVLSFIYFFFLFFFYLFYLLFIFFIFFMANVCCIWIISSELKKHAEEQTSAVASAYYQFFNSTSESFAHIL
jgi:ABC-type bacteriocin/lantibiotic exporter with double-glycine peptidase domain